MQVQNTVRTKGSFDHWEVDVMDVLEALLKHIMHLDYGPASELYLCALEKLLCICYCIYGWMSH